MRPSHQMSAHCILEGNRYVLASLHRGGAGRPGPAAPARGPPPPPRAGGGGGGGGGRGGGGGGRGTSGGGGRSRRRSLAGAGEGQRPLSNVSNLKMGDIVGPP